MRLLCGSTHFPDRLICRFEDPLHRAGGIQRHTHRIGTDVTARTTKYTQAWTTFANFRKGYEHDAAWKIEGRGGYIQLTGRGAGGRTIEIFANVPIDIRLPANRDREGEALRRQASIAEELERRGLKPAVLRPC